jgi:transcription antitermination factor NusG
MQANWYVLRSKPHKEDVLWQHACSQGYELFYPRIPVKAVNPRARKVVPYFPGYMFVHVAIQEVGISIFQWMPHAHGLICFDNAPASVSDDMIEAIRTRVYAIVQAGGELFLQLQHGDLLTIRSGPFAGYEAIFDARLSGGERVRVLLEMLNDRQVPVVLSEARIERRR